MVLIKKESERECACGGEETKDKRDKTKGDSLKERGKRQDMGPKQPAIQPSQASQAAFFFLFFSFVLVQLRPCCCCCCFQRRLEGAQLDLVHIDGKGNNRQFLLRPTNFRTTTVRIDHGSRSAKKSSSLCCLLLLVRCPGWKSIFCFMVLVAGGTSQPQPPPNPTNHDDLFSVHPPLRGYF